MDTCSNHLRINLLEIFKMFQPKPIFVDNNIFEKLWKKLYTFEGYEL